MSTGTTADLGIGGNFVGLAACAALEVGTALFGEFVRGFGAGFGSGAGGSCTGLPLTMLPPTVGSLNVNVSAIVPRLAGGVVALATRGPLFAPLSGVEGGPFVVSALLPVRGPGFAAFSSANNLALSLIGVPLRPDMANASGPPMPIAATNARWKLGSLMSMPMSAAVGIRGGIESCVSGDTTLALSDRGVGVVAVHEAGSSGAAVDATGGVGAAVVDTLAGATA